MYCPKCGKYNSDDSEVCVHCGADLTDVSIGDDSYAENNAADEIYGDIKIIKASINPNLSGGSVIYRQKIQENKEFADIDSIRCPKCGSDNIQYVYETDKKGFSAEKGCCGLIFSPFGWLCGFCGANKKEITEFWVCKKCGARFDKNDNLSQVDDIKRKAQFLFSTPDETIENVGSIIDTLNRDLTRMNENKESINKILSDLIEEENQKNPSYKNYSNVSFAITLILIIVVGIFLLIFLSSKYSLILGLIVTAVWVVGLLICEYFVDDKVEDKICSPDFIRRKKALNNKTNAQNDEINKVNADLKQLNKIKEAKDVLIQNKIL
ncbi:MAG: zinc-ribbon domain-containing protein [Oscillospiraceae bacterium]